MNFEVLSYDAKQLESYDNSVARRQTKIYLSSSSRWIHNGSKRFLEHAVQLTLYKVSSMKQTWIYTWVRNSWSKIHHVKTTTSLRVQVIEWFTNLLEQPFIQWWWRTCSKNSLFISHDVMFEKSLPMNDTKSGFSQWRHFGGRGCLAAIRRPAC